jgi:hypothetical protein
MSKLHCRREFPRRSTALLVRISTENAVTQKPHRCANTGDNEAGNSTQVDLPPVLLNARARGNRTGRNDTFIGAANAALNAHRMFGEFARVGCLAGRYRRLQRVPV